MLMFGLKFYHDNEEHLFDVRNIAKRNRFISATDNRICDDCWNSIIVKSLF